MKMPLITKSTAAAAAPAVIRSLFGSRFAGVLAGSGSGCGVASADGADGGGGPGGVGGTCCQGTFPRLTDVVCANMFGSSGGPEPCGMTGAPAMDSDTAAPDSDFSVCAGTPESGSAWVPPVGSGSPPGSLSAIGSAVSPLWRCAN
jgi:hypothetical protein